MLKMTNRKRFFYLVSLVLAAGALSAGCESVPNKDLTVKYYYTQTDDGMTLALLRYQPVRPVAGKDPVILCHGLGYNLLFWDLDKNVSLPRYLAARRKARRWVDVCITGVHYVLLSRLPPPDFSR